MMRTNSFLYPAAGFVVTWIVTFALLLGVRKCWFFDPTRGEFSVSELASLVFYALAVVIALGKRWYPVAALLLLLLLEEANYGQIFFASRETLNDDEEQVSLHTRLPGVDKVAPIVQTVTHFAVPA